MMDSFEIITALLSRDSTDYLLSLQIFSGVV